MTYDDLAPAQIKNQNDTNTVLRFKVQATANGIDENGNMTKVGEPYTMLWLGDSNSQQSRYMCAMYGDYLQSDMVQLAHHGNVGCEKALYEAVKATVTWFPHTVSAYQGYLHPSNKDRDYRYQADWYAVNENPNAKYVYVSGGTDGAGGRLGINLTLPFGNDGLPAYNDVYNTLQGVEAKIEYTKNTEIGGVAIEVPPKTPAA